MHFIGSLVSLAFLIIEIKAAVISPPKQEDFELLILHNNDMHARFEQTSQLSSICSKIESEQNKCYGGFARVAHVVKENRAMAATSQGPPVLYLNAGDTYTGTIWFAVYKWKIAAAFVNMLEPDAVSLGNHELDNGVSGLSPFIKNLTCPVVTANIKLENEPEINAIANLKKSIVLTVSGRKIGIIGYLTPDTKFLVSPNKIEYEDEVVAIQKEVNRLQNEGVNILIALGHSGFEADQRIAREVKGIDIVIGGHTNTFLWNGKVPDAELSAGPYPTVVVQSSGRKVPVVQAYAYTKYLGKLHVSIDSEGELIEYDGQPILLDSSVPRDPEVLELLESFRPGVLNYSNHISGISKVLLEGTNSVCRLRECNLGNLVADSMVYSYVENYTSDGNSWTDAPIAIVQGGGIRSSIDASKNDGKITRADILNVLPFDNQIVLVNVTGETLKSALEWSVFNYNEVEMPGAFLHFSGIHVKYNISKPPGKRVISASARCGACPTPQYSDVMEDKYYQILITSFLFLGGDNFTMFRDNVVYSKMLLLNDADALNNYISKKSPIYPEIQGRITVYKSQNSGVTNLALPNSMLLILLVYINYNLSS